MTETPEPEQTFEEWLESIRGVKELKRLHEDAHENLVEWAKDTWDLIDWLGTDVSRYEQASKLLDVLRPTRVDADLWEAIALGKDVHLISGQQGGVGRMQATSARRGATRGNDYGRVHDKQDAPAQFIERQGKAAVRAAAKVLRLEQELEAARAEQADLDNGLRAFATTCLLTQMRKTASSMFAVGPAWTILRAIAGSVGDEISDADRRRQTSTILVVLHALAGDAAFEMELKHVIRTICRRYEGQARRRGQPGTDLDGPIDYAGILDELAWPDEETLRKLGPVTRDLTETDVREATERLLDVALDGGPLASKVADFLLSWWDGDDRDFRVSDLGEVGRVNSHDMIIILGYMGNHRRIQPDMWIAEEQLMELRNRWPAQA